MHVRKGSEKSYADNNWLFLWGDNIEGDYPDVVDAIKGVTTASAGLTVVRLNVTEVRLTADTNISSVELYNAAGGLVSENKQVGSNEVVLTLPHRGIYVAKLRLANGSVKVVKI